MRGLVGLSAHTAFHCWPAQCAARILLLSNKLISYRAAGTNGCLEFRRRATEIDGQVSAEWSRGPGSMARRARNSVAPLRLSPAGMMLARIGRLSAGVGHRHPATIRKASLMAEPIRRAWAMQHQTSLHYPVGKAWVLNLPPTFPWHRNETWIAPKHFSCTEKYL